jgi:uncharacterized membrane protein YphA (DoxX/SURF4 family)
VASAALNEGGMFHRHVTFGWIQGGTILISAALLAGYLTPIAAMAGLAVDTLVFLGTPSWDLHVTMTFCVDALALALLGPGAYSIDAHFFGRRLVLPPNSP